ncbi:AAA family ATPase [Streptomyces tanashiensis]
MSMEVSEGAEDPSHSAAPGTMSTVHPPRVRLEASAPGGRAVQAARDLYVSETHHHGRPAGPLAVVEPVLPTDEAAAEVFVGRSAETRDVLAVLDPTHGATGMVVASSVAGLAGIGKTALARSCAAEAVARGWYAGGAVFVDLDGYAPDPTDQVMPEHVFAPMLHALGHQGPLDASAAGQAAQYHRLLAERAAERRPVLLVLDNASSSAQIADLMPRSRVHRTLITSRHTLATRGSRTLELGTLTPVGARALVAEQLVFLSPDDSRTRLDVQGTERLCHLCGHLPLALHIATALLARDPDLTPGALADELARAQHRLDVLDDGERAVRAAFELSYRRLTPDQALLFRLMPLNPGPHIATDAAARLIDRAEDEAARLIRELARAHVVERAGTGVWRQHDLMRAYAIELLGRERDAQGEASNRLIEHYIAMAAAALSTLNTGTATASPAFRAAEDALAWCDREQSNLQAAISMAATFGDGDGALRIQEALIAVHAHRHQTAEWEAAARSAVVFAREAKDYPGRSRALHELMTRRDPQGVRPPSHPLQGGCGHRTSPQPSRRGRDLGPQGPDPTAAGTAPCRRFRSLRRRIPEGGAARTRADPRGPGAGGSGGLARGLRPAGPLRREATHRRRSSHERGPPAHLTGVPVPGCIMSVTSRATAPPPCMRRASGVTSPGR